MANRMPSASWFYPITATPPGRVVSVHPTSATPVIVAQSGPQPGAPPKSALRVRIGTPAPVATWVGAGSEAAAEPSDSGGVAAAESETLPRCPKHPSELAAEKCYVCSKPICPKCMELFGYVCSPLCRAKAASHGIAVPIYEGQSSVV